MPSRHVGLVGDDHQGVAGGLQARQRLRDARQHVQLIEAVWRIGASIADQGAVDDAVPVQEHRRLRHKVDSHLVAAALSSGCDTSRCHTTAWKTSLCGVTVSGFTVGTITQASATCAVYPPSRPTMPTMAAPMRRAY